MIKTKSYFIVALFCALISTAQASDMDAAKSLIEEMKATHVKVYGHKCGRDWKNKYNFVFQRTKMMFVGKVISVDEAYAGISKIRYKIIIPTKGITPIKLERIDIYYPLSYKELGINKKRPPPKIGTIKTVMAYNHQGIFQEFNFSYCAEKKLTVSSKTTDGN